MKLSKIISVILLVAIMAVMLAGCTDLVSLFENEDVRSNTDKMILGIIGNDFESAYSVVDSYYTAEDFTKAFIEMRETIGEVDECEMVLLSAYTNKSLTADGSVTTYTAAYKLTVDSQVYVVDVEQTSLSDDLHRFYITPFKNTDYYSVGNITNMSDASAFQWIMLISNLVVIGLAVYAIIDCCCHKIKLKPLWIILIILGIVSVGATISANGFRFNFNCGWITAYSAFITYGGGTKVFRMLIPIGTFAYFIFRIITIVKDRCFKNEVADTASNMNNTIDNFTEE